MDRLLIVCAGGAVGSGARYLVTIGSAAAFGTTFPFGTLFVNVSGCFLISLIMHVGAAIALPAKVQLLLTTGFLGGLTTFSTFDYETTSLFEEGALRTGVLNIGITVVACVVATVLGLLLARFIVGSGGVGH
jgi:CrcB protein